MDSTEISNYVRKLEHENGLLKTALAEYKAEDEKRKYLIENFFSFSTSPEQSAENISPEKSEGNINGIIICY